MDTKASFWYSYSYCEDTDTCLRDEWNYINQWCRTKWIPGWQLDIKENCKARELPDVYCKPFEVTEGFTMEDRGRVALPQGTTCTFRVDATRGMGRITFNKSNDNIGWLGVLINSHKPGEPITIPQGQVQDIKVYNGKKFGSTYFEVIVSGAASLTASLSLAAVASSLV